jgi:integrase
MKQIKSKIQLVEPHLVPLSRQAIETLRALKEISGAGSLIFPGERDHEKPMSENTILAGLKRMG